MNISKKQECETFSFDCCSALHRSCFRSHCCPDHIFCIHAEGFKMRIDCKKKLQNTRTIKSISHSVGRPLSRISINVFEMKAEKWQKGFRCPQFLPHFSLHSCNVILCHIGVSLEFWHLMKYWFEQNLECQTIQWRNWRSQRLSPLQFRKFLRAKGV